MRLHSTSMLVGVAAMAAIASSGGGVDTIAPTEPGNGRRFRAAPTYRPKHPATEGDHERIRQAEIKRARKAERLRAAQANGGIG